jgi:hypothetical protein
MPSPPLRSLHALLDGEEHRRAHVEEAEIPLRERVAVEIHLLAVGHPDEAVTGQGEHGGDAAVEPSVVLFLHPAPAPDVILEAATGGVERIAEGDEHVLVGMVKVLVAAHHHLAARHDHLHANARQSAVAMVAVGLRDHHLAAGDAAVELFQVGDLLERRRPHRLVHRDVVETHLRFGLHGGCSVTGSGRPAPCRPQPLPPAPFLRAIGHASSDARAAAPSAPDTPSRGRRAPRGGRPTGARGPDALTPAAWGGRRGSPPA